MENEGSNNLGILQDRNLPRHSPPSAREIWQARLPRNSVGSRAINPSPPPPRANSPFSSLLSLTRAIAACVTGANSHHDRHPNSPT
jgi:hypothetical protein